jgi:hypothetical protein
VDDVDFEITGFSPPYAAFNQFATAPVPFIDLQRSLITVGSQPLAHPYPFGVHSVWKAVSLSAMALCVLGFNSPSLATTALFQSLDGSEKGSFSYWFGMGFLKIAVERYMGISWLTHVDRLVQSGDIVLAPGANTRGDLVGLDVAANWHAFEAKGRSQIVSHTVLAAAKIQAQQIHTVFTAVPATFSASGVSLGRTPIHVRIDDPKKGGSQSTAAWPPDSFFSDYYRSLIEFLQLGQATIVSRYGARFRMCPLYDATGSPNGYNIGILEGIYKIPSAAPREIPSLPMIADATNTGASLGLDGILVEKS